MMLVHEIDFPEAYFEFKKYVKENGYTKLTHSVEKYKHKLVFDSHETFLIPISGWDKNLELDIKAFIKSYKEKEDIHKLIFGKDPTERIVSCEVSDDSIELYIEHPDRVEVKVLPNKYWILSHDQLDSGFRRLEGNLYYNFGKTYSDRYEFYQDKKRYYKKDIFSVGDFKEAAMIKSGFTYYKNMRIEDVSVLAFDIESTSLAHDHTAKVLLISNTYRKNGVVTRKLFAYDDYASEADFFDAWCSWVRDINPSILIGHNIFMYDLPYLRYCAEQAGTSLKLGRDGSDMFISERESKFRFDGSQDYDYKRCFIYGREIVDTMFTAMKYDFSRKYASYKLKYIIAQEGLEVDNRQFYDASQIRFQYQNKEEWEKIKKYCENDSDDSLALFDLMIPAYFYYSRSIPKSFQSVMYSASGSQINSFLIRSYLQDGHSLPKSSPEESFDGAISLGNPGVYHNVFKVDVASLYPSIMLQYEVYDKYKDPKAHFQTMVNYFTNERLNNKKLGKDTGERYYKDLEQAQKIVINSAYGMMGASGLLFNSPKNASFVTLKGREVLQKAIDWALANNFKLVNADTDSIAICKQDFSEIDDNAKNQIISEVNKLFPEKIHFEDDGYYKHFLVIKTKNYVLDDGKRLKVKGSALKATSKEKALKEFIDKCIQRLFANDTVGLMEDYKSYIREIFNLKDISRWTSRKTITEKIYSSERANETKVLDAIKDEEVQIGEKVYVYFDTNNLVKLDKNWTNDHNPYKLVEKLYKTLLIFDTVIDKTLITKYHLKTKRALLEEMLNETK